MVIDCKHCELPAHPLSSVPCAQQGNKIYKNSTIGKQQQPLLHLLYEICTSKYDPQERQVRAIWGPPKYSEKTGRKLMPALVYVDTARATREVHHLIGMALAQMPYALPIWAQSSHDHQQQIAQAIVDMLKGLTLEMDLISTTDAEGFKGKAFSWEQDASMRQSRLQDNLLRQERLQTEIEFMQARHDVASEALTKCDLDLAAIDVAIAKLKHEEAGGAAHELAVLTQQRSTQAAEVERLRLMMPNGQSLIDELCEAKEDHRLIDRQRRYLLDSAAEMPELRLKKQRQALSDDYVLQPENYLASKAGDYETWKLILNGNTTAAEMFLFMDPRLKYGESKVCCMQTFLSAQSALDCFQRLDDANLIQPGPYAKVGVFIINALVPGSYDQRHREMVQSELDEITQGMVEHKLDPTIRCHSCGTDECSGLPPAQAASSWIRDHHPPTALYEMGKDVCKKLGIARPKRHHQILLPQCRECSKRQGAIMSKVKEIIKGLKVTGPDWLAAITKSLNPLDFADFERLVLKPMDGWPGGIEEDCLNALAVTGGPGSFSGFDEKKLKSLGQTKGCHTCIDITVQNDPYRHISWIADHQPPTALIARGLMEMPQVVYPHCWACSEKQSSMVAELSRLFDGCFGKDFKGSWVDKIRDAKWESMKETAPFSADNSSSASSASSR